MATLANTDATIAVVIIPPQNTLVFWMNGEGVDAVEARVEIPCGDADECRSCADRDTQGGRV